MKYYIQAARLRTLPLSISGIIVGSSLGFKEQLATGANTSEFGIFGSAIFWLAIATTIAFQVLSNFANDYGDGVKGTDANRTGEQRMVASGVISSKQMKNAVVITAVLSLLLALGLIYVAFGSDNFLYTLLFTGLGLASIVAAIKYTVGKSAYGYSGFGDVFVFAFFGLLAVLGSYFLFTKSFDFFVVLPAVTIGLLSTAVLNLNNMRDRENDKKAGKKTLVVKIGAEFAKYYHYYLLVASFLFSFLFTGIRYSSPLQFLFMIAFIPLGLHLHFVYKNETASQFDGELKKVALSTFLFAVLFAIGQLVTI